MSAAQLKRSYIVVLFIKIFVFIFLFNANDVQAKTSAIEINYLNVTELNNELRLDADISYELNSEVRNALVNGIVLMFQIEVQIKSLQKWRWNKLISTTIKTHTLKYHALSKQYVLENLGTAETDTFPDLESALIHQGRVSALRIAEAGDLNKKNKYVVRLRARLLSNKLPLPLRMRSYFSPKWRLNSRWHEWPL